MMDLIISTATQGFIYALLSYGIYITYKILDGEAVIAETTTADTKADFVIEKVERKSENKSADITIKLVDRDAVSTTLKGKNYTIPLEIMVIGADGVKKNILANRLRMR